MVHERYGNRQKYLNPSPIQRMLLGRFQKKIRELVQQTDASAVLDVGCGEGFGIEHLNKHLPHVTYVGGDFSAEAMMWGSTNLNYCATLINMDIHHLPFSNNCFPLVMCLEVIEHLPAPVIALQELARVSAEYILLSTPHEPWFRGANLMRGKHKRALGNDPEHLQNFTGRALRRMVDSTIDILWHRYVFPWQIILGRKRN